MSQVSDVEKKSFFMKQAFDFARAKAESGEWTWDEAFAFVQKADESTKNKSEKKEQ